MQLLRQVGRRVEDNAGTGVSGEPCIGFLQLSISTEFGAFLDPVADKLMVSTALILLATAPPPPISRPAMVVPVLVIIGREIAMSSLREWAAASGGGAHKVEPPGGAAQPWTPHLD